ncbi:MAG: iron ABC transporter permease [Flavobacteriaceae bacterium]|nr:iron ABC transporter permease [Flavobacteriaceae bacterium]
MKSNWSIFLLFFLLLIVAWVNIGLGSVNIPQAELLKILFTQQEVNPTWSYIIWEYRLPKAITAILVGSALGVSGMLMQTLFRNPLAGPYVLGLSSGASLGVAVLILGGSLLGGWLGTLLFSKWALVIFSSLGSLLVLLAILSTAIKIKDTMALLIIGLMFASLTGAVVSVLSYFSPASNLQQYIFWSFGSLGNLNWQEVSILFLCFFIGISICVFCLKNLNALLLGEKYAKSLGVNIKKNRFLVIFSTSILAGSVTAFAGPIAFIGLAVPHLIRQLIKTNNHFILMPSVVFGGAIIMLICDTIAQLPGSEYTLPINAITSIFGAPIVIWLLVKKQKIIF